MDADVAQPLDAKFTFIVEVSGADCFLNLGMLDPPVLSRIVSLLRRPDILELSDRDDRYRRCAIDLYASPFLVDYNW